MDREYCLLKCRIRKGMFDDEYLVTIEALDQNGKKIHIFTFADKEEIRTNSFPKGKEEVDGYLTVSPLEEQEKISSVVLPKSTFANGTVVAIESSNLMSLRAD